MKREILFKAKYKNTGKWLYGDLFTGLNDEMYISTFVKIGTTTKAQVKMIDKNTICQFINQKDKNGEKIFEGDYDADGNCIIWCENCNGFEFAAIDVPTKEICVPCHRCDGNFFFSDQINNFVIIGNVAD